MIVLDANVPLYADNPASAHHGTCRAWLEHALNGSEQVGLPWQTLLAFIRIATNNRVFERPLDSIEAAGPLVTDAALASRFGQPVEHVILMAFPKELD